MHKIITDSPLVSVGIPLYNHEKYICETIKSIINQTYKNIELIIIDDGSKDSSFDIAKSFENQCKKRFSRVVFITRQNKGTAYTFRQIYEISEGKYVYIIASDDCAKPNAIERLVKEAEAGGYVLVVGDNEIINSNGERVAWNKKRNIVPLERGFSTFWAWLTCVRPEIRDMERFGSYGSLISGNYITNGQLHLRSAYFQTIGYTEKAPLEDLWINIQLSKIGKFKFIDEILFSYRWHETNTIKNLKKINKYIILTKNCEKSLIKGTKWEEEFNKNITNIKTYFSIGNLIQFYLIENLSEKKRFLKIGPFSLPVYVKKYSL